MRLMLPEPNILVELKNNTFYANPRPEYRYLVISGKTIELEKNPLNDLWYDEYDTIWALPEYPQGTDQVIRCGVGFFSFSTKNPLTAYCGVHDYMYSSPAYQYFHTRMEADVWLKDAIKRANAWQKILATPMYYATRWFGSWFWENEKTRLQRLAYLTTVKHDLNYEIKSQNELKKLNQDIRKRLHSLQKKHCGCGDEITEIQGQSRNNRKEDGKER